MSVQEHSSLITPAAPAPTLPEPAVNDAGARESVTHSAMAARGDSWAWLRELVRYRDLLYMLAWRDIRIRYKQTLMGLLWAILMPGAIIIAGVVVRLAMAKSADKPLSLQDLTPVFVKSVAWAFFVASIRSGTTCLINNSNLVTRIYFPKLIFPLSSVLGNLFDFAVASCVLTVILAFTGVTISEQLLWVPVLMALLVVLTSALAIFLSAAALFLRDVKYLVEIFVMFAIFITPVFFSASIFGRWQWVLLINPVAPLLEGLSDAVVFGRTPDLLWLTYSAAISLVGFAGAVAFFRRLEGLFAECI
ncbi:MAG TPA: ABC transporter permease [Planctomycetaceae bacterium]|jgi:lipopolysaccharide transport system permease protein|nr:ABC transporter permease [Planctomycetaceae bacterium]